MLAREAIERRLHAASDLVVAALHGRGIVGGLWAVLRPRHGPPDFDRDLRRQRHARQQDRRETPGDLHGPGKGTGADPLAAEARTEPVAAGHYVDRMRPAVAHHWTAGHPLSERQLDESLPPRKIDPPPIGPWPEALVVAAWVCEHREARIERACRVPSARRSLADPSHELVEPGDAEGRVERERDQGTVEPALAIPGREEYCRVGRERAARVIPDEQDGSPRRDGIQAAHLGVEVAAPEVHQGQDLREEADVALECLGAELPLGGPRPGADPVELKRHRCAPRGPATSPSSPPRPGMVAR